jgi:undecaprenyl diphosphate synthase
MSDSIQTDLPRENLPVHIGIIMDGNGRWAKLRKLKRSAGHDEGLTTAKKIVLAAADIGIPYLSLYTFSTENWKRAAEEVSFLMGLVRKNLTKQYNFYRDNQIRLIHCGNLSGLPREIQQEIDSITKDTQHFTRLTVNIALNYGGRDEILRAVQRCLNKLELDDTATITENDLSQNLDNKGMPDPDLIIRTGGEKRLSNFLLWESAYSELFFSEKLWPDWTVEDLVYAVQDYQRRIRKFGAAV